VIYEQNEVGNFISATGDATDILAYRIFVVDLPSQNIGDFFEPSIRQSGEFDFGVCLADKPPQGPWLPMDSILAHIPQAERHNAYILYQTDRCIENGLWDIRGW
jgi:hypothetical protein